MGSSLWVSVSRLLKIADASLFSASFRSEARNLLLAMD